MGSQMSRIACLAIAFLLWVAAIGLNETTDGLLIRFGGGFTQQSPGELRFWLASILLIFPAGGLLGWVFHERIGTLINKISSAFEAAAVKERKTVFILVFLASLASAMMGNRILLFGLPVTDDELGSIFGAKIWLQGHLMMPQPEPFGAFKHQFMYLRDGWIANMDWPGNLAAWAIDHLLGLQGAVFSIATAITCVSIAAVVAARLSMKWAIAAVFLFWLSPMASALSFTTHQHQLSRAAFSVFIACLWFAKERDSKILWILAGLSAGLMAMFRPMEAFFLTLPIGILLAWVAWKGRMKSIHSRSIFFVLMGAAPFVLLFLAYNHSVTGYAWLPPRFAIPESAEGLSSVLSFEKIWHRFGTNTGYNFFLLVFWSLGPLTLPLLFLGASRDWLTRVLCWSLLSDLALGLLHDIPGIHIVGPIHYSECVVPILLVGVHGLNAGLQALENHQKIRQMIKGVLAGSLLIYGIYFNFHQWSAMHDSARITAEINEFIGFQISKLQGIEEGAPIRPSVIVSPSFMQVWRNIPRYQSRGTWVYEWPTASPGLGDPLTFVAEGFDDSLRARFKGREFYHLVLKAAPPFIDLIPLNQKTP
jgi:hypothetical protein